MQRVTDFRIDKVEIDEAKYYALPVRTRKLIEAYSSPLKPTRNGYLRFELPIGRWKEIQESMQESSL